jgi:proteic killer suppression protein
MWYLTRIFDFFMEISFKTKKIATLCNKNNKAVKKFGADCAEKLQLRLQQLWSAECLEDMKYGRPHPLNGNREGQFAIDLAGAVRLVFEALDPIPKTSDDATDWGSLFPLPKLHGNDFRH